MTINDVEIRQAENNEVTVGVVSEYDIRFILSNSKFCFFINAVSDKISKQTDKNTEVCALGKKIIHAFFSF